MTGWRTVQLGDEIELSYGKSLPSDLRKDGDFLVYGSNGTVGKHSEPLIDGPGIIIGRKGSVGEVHYSSAPFWPIDTTYYIINKANNCWRFLYHLLRCINLTKLNSHSTIPGLNRDNVYSITTSLPDIDEQERIAAVLDFIEQKKTEEELLLQTLLTLKHAAMRELFTRGLHGEAQKETEIGLIPESWEICQLGDHFELESGGTPSRYNLEYWSSGTIPWVKTTEINYKLITTTEECITQKGLSESAAKILPAGTLLMAMYGQGITRGKVAILGIDAACNQACAAIIARDNTIFNQYLYHFFNYRYEHIRQLAHGGQQQNLNLEIVRSLRVVFPSTSEQHKIVEILDAIDRKIELHKKKKTLLEELFKSLLHKLMTGEIRVADLDLSAIGKAGG